MANHKSAIKRHRQSLKRRERNRVVRADARNVVRRVREAVQASDLKLAKTLLLEAQSTIARTSSKGVYHERTAARKFGRLAKLVHQAGTAEPKAKAPAKAPKASAKAAAAKA